MLRPSLLLALHLSLDVEQPILSGFLAASCHYFTPIYFSPSSWQHDIDTMSLAADGLEIPPRPHIHSRDEPVSTPLLLRLDSHNNILVDEDQFDAMYLDEEYLQSDLDQEQNTTEPLQEAAHLTSEVSSPSQAPDEYSS